MGTGNPPGRPKGTPKTGGRAKGTPNKATVEVKAFCRGILESHDYRVALKRRVKAGELPPGMEQMLWAYAYGKPKEQVELTGAEGGPIVTSIVRRIVDADAGD